MQFPDTLMTFGPLRSVIDANAMLSFPPALQSTVMAARGLGQGVAPLTQVVWLEVVPWAAAGGAVTSTVPKSKKSDTRKDAHVR